MKKFLITLKNKYNSIIQQFTVTGESISDPNTKNQIIDNIVYGPAQYQFMSDIEQIAKEKYVIDIFEVTQKCNGIGNNIVDEVIKKCKSILEENIKLEEENIKKFELSEYKRLKKIYGDIN